MPDECRFVIQDLNSNFYYMRLITDHMNSLIINSNCNASSFGSSYNCTISLKFTKISIDLVYLQAIESFSENVFISLVFIKQVLHGWKQLVQMQISLKEKD